MWVLTHRFFGAEETVFHFNSTFKSACGIFLSEERVLRAS
jgi:hypothetical protein